MRIKTQSLKDTNTRVMTHAFAFDVTLHLTHLEQELARVHRLTKKKLNEDLLCTH